MTAMNPRSFRKRSLSSDHEASNVKKPRVTSDGATCEEPIPSGQVRHLPVAWDSTSLQPSLSWGRCRPQVVENSSSIQTQYNVATRKMDPVIINVDDFVEEPTIISLDAIESPPMFPPRRIRVVDDDTPQDIVDLTDSAQPVDKDTIPLRVSNDNFIDGTVSPASLRIHELPAHIDLRDIKRLLRTSGFSSSNISEIVMFRDRTVAVAFTDAYAEDAAYSVLSQTTIPFPWKNCSGRLDIQRGRQGDNEPQPSARGRLPSPIVIDSLENLASRESPSSSSKQSTDSLYGSLRRDVYEDTSDDENTSSPISELFMTQTVAETPDTDITKSKTSETIEIYSSSSSDSEGYLSNTTDTDSTDNETDRPVGAGANSHNHTSRFSTTLRQAKVHLKSQSAKSSAPTRRLPVDHLASARSLASRSDSSCQVPKNLPNAPFSRARRVLVPPRSCLPFVTVSMRADVQFFHRENNYRLSSYSMPCQRSYQHVENACLVGDTVVIGYGDGPCQISLITLLEEQAPRMTELEEYFPHERPNKTYRKGAASVSCLAPAFSDDRTIRFFSGGYDKSVKLWSICGTDRPQTEMIVRATPTAPLALAYRDSMVFYGGGKQLFMIDVNHPSASPTTAPLSNIVHQLHAHPEAPSVFILELDHLDTQIELFDDRKKHGFNRAADCKFGHRSADGKSSRYSRGSTHLSYFVRGYSDGCVCIWDYRNARHPVMKGQAKWSETIVHTNFAGSKIACLGTNALHFVDDGGKIL